MKQLLFILTLLFLVGCTNDQVNTSDTNHPPGESSSETPNDSNDSEDESDEVTENDVDYSKFFLPDGSTAHFLGDGNEFATYTVYTKWLSDRYVSIVEDNGGLAMLKIYRVMDEYDKIDKVYEEPIEGLPSEVQYPSVDELNNLPLIESYLNGPIEVGTEIGKWKIVEIDTTLETPYQTFEDVFVLEEETEDFINRKYFVEGFGEVKREAIMHIEGEDDYIVTSTLEKIDSAK
ncbi:putative protein OS=Ureibacillus acetophenoni OX=614649 GN=SAMN05877842_103189 PE=4 SV=1 [Ureibacillus acetophenoni]